MIHFNRGWLRRLRRDKKMTLREAASAVNLNRSTVWRAENAPNSGGTNITVDTLLALLNFYGASITDVFTEVEDVNI